MTESTIEKRTLHEMIVSMLGIGIMPIMPGTWCSIVVALPALMLESGWIVQLSMLALALVLSVLSLISIPKVQAKWGTDPSAVVIDEAVGMLMILATPFPYMSPLWLGVSVFVFRVFDVVKPWPINLVNARTEPWAVLVDDVLAAIMSIISLAIMFTLLQTTIWFS